MTYFFYVVPSVESGSVVITMFVKVLAYSPPFPFFQRSSSIHTNNSQSLCGRDQSLPHRQRRLELRREHGGPRGKPCPLQRLLHGRLGRQQVERIYPPKHSVGRE